MQHNDTIRILISCASQAGLEACLALFRNTEHIVRAHRVASEQDLLDALRDRQWDLLVIDDDHPELSPADALGTLAATGNDVPALVRTADPYSPDALTWRHAGAREVLPIGADEVLPLTARREIDALRTLRALTTLQTQYEEVARRCELLLGTAREAIGYIVDGMHIHANARYAALFGFTEVEELASVPLIDLIDGPDQQEFKEALKRYRASPDTETAISFSGHRSDGTTFEAELVLSTASFEGERCMQVVVHEHNGSPAAGVPRPAGGDDLQALIGTLGNAAGGQLVLLAIDAFTQHRHKLGVSGADRLINKLGAFIAQETGWKTHPWRTADAVLAWHLASDDADATAEQARKALGALAHHIHEIGSQSVSCTACVHICPIDPQSQESAEGLLDRCWSGLDDAAARAVSLRASDPARVSISRNAAPTIVGTTATIARPALEEALRAGELRLLFQPIVSLRGDTNEYYEVFARHEPSAKPAQDWLAEHYAGTSSVELDQLITTQALHALDKHRARHPQTRLIVPVGVGSVLDPDYVLSLQGKLQALQLSADSITIAVDHQIAAANLKHAKEFAAQLGTLGARLCITEVHSGANPMPDLAHLRPALVRIADELSQVLDDTESRNTLLKPLIEALHGEQIASVMPNVDSASALAMLWQLGVNFIQGNYLQPPQPQMSYEFTDLN